MSAAASETALEALNRVLGGSIPYPLAKATAILDKQNGYMTSVAIFPHGRSLERRITSFAQPRMLIGADLGARPIHHVSGLTYAGNEIFVAHTPGNKQLQIISRNNQTLQYDFFLLNNYGTRSKPTLQRALPGLCTACHQNGGPIFPVAPWNESVTGNEELREKTRQASPRGVLPLPRQDVHFFISQYDGLVREASSLQVQRACLIGCGTSLKCRKNFLAAWILGKIGGHSGLQAMAFWGKQGSQREPGPEFSEYFTPKRMTEFLRLIENLGFPEALTVLGGQIPDREHVEARVQGDRDPLARLPIQAFVFGVPPRRLDSDPIYEFATPRFIDLAALSTLMDQCLRMTTYDATRALTEIPRTAILKKLESQEFEEFVAARWLPRADDVVAFMSGGAIQGPGRKTVDLLQTGWAPPFDTVSYKAVVEPFRNQRSVDHWSSKPRALRPASQLFQNYCTSCHGGSMPPAPRLPLEDLQKMRAYQGDADRTVRGLIGGVRPLMPPLGAPQPSSAEREEMLRSLKEPTGEIRAQH